MQLRISGEAGRLSAPTYASYRWSLPLTSAESIILNRNHPSTTSDHDYHISVEGNIVGTDTGIESYLYGSR
jgi:hypothetical protein